MRSHLLGDLFLELFLELLLEVHDLELHALLCLQEARAQVGGLGLPLGQLLLVLVLQHSQLRPGLLRGLPRFTGLPFKPLSPLRYLLGPGLGLVRLSLRLGPPGVEVCALVLPVLPDSLDLGFDPLLLQ